MIHSPRRCVVFYPASPPWAARFPLRSLPLYSHDFVDQIENHTFPQHVLLEGSLSLMGRILVRPNTSLLRAFFDFPALRSYSTLTPMYILVVWHAWVGCLMSLSVIIPVFP